MKIAIFTHPAFLHSQSMPRFASMLKTGLHRRGHTVEILTAKPWCYQWNAPAGIKKWLAYIDQYLLFPLQAKKRIKPFPADTLFVFTDNALGPWIPLVKDRPHVIHCHDFMAQLSAKGKIPENPTSWTGRHYQAFIRRGYQKARHFISVSDKTKADLESFLPTPPIISEVVYNGMNRTFFPTSPEAARAALTRATGIPLTGGYLLHVGGNQWYKNRVGVVELYNAWRSNSANRLPLLLVGEKANDSLMEAYNASPFRNDIYLLTEINDGTLQTAYAGASVFLFPSFAEGFGWPIAEAMASGCPVVTTGEAPMTEVAGEAAFFLPRKTTCNNLDWAAKGARVIEDVLQLSVDDRANIIEKGLRNVTRFDSETALDAIEQIYLQVLNSYQSAVAKR